ncbi:MAG: MalY/PatB family protein [Anaerolineales bacterium]
MGYDFDACIDRRGTDSLKWGRYGEDVLPLWVADMDFRSPEPVIRALQERVAHGVFGYGMEPPDLRELIVERLQRLHNWTISPEAILFMPGVVTGFNLAAMAVASPGQGLLLQTPVYFPMLHTAENARLRCDAMELCRKENGRYVVDYERMAETIHKDTQVFLLCNPHNPVGRVFRRDELQRMAEICLSNGIYIISDEIHCDLVFGGQEHVSIASLAPEIAERTITLIAPSKTYNIAGLHCSMAIIPDADLRRRFQEAYRGLINRPSVLGYTAALAAYRHGDPWLREVLHYLEDNRNLVFDFVSQEMRGVSMTRPEGTYLAWLDCRHTNLDDPHKHFLQEAGVALNDGAAFGPGGEGFVRLNFACCRSLLERALERIKGALPA